MYFSERLKNTKNQKKVTRDGNICTTSINENRDTKQCF